MKDVQALGAALAARFDGQRRGATALELRQRSISYSELAVASQSIANELEHLDIGDGVHIGVLANDGSLIVPAMIAALARGCVFALLDTTHPANYLREFVDTANLNCLLVEGSLFSLADEALRGSRAKPLPLSDRIYSTGGQARSILNMLARARQRELYIYFSSGTSGKPKPILGRADSLLQFVEWEIAVLGLDRAVRVSQLTSPSHDPYLRDIFTTLIAGGTVCIPDSRQIVLSPFELGKWLDDAGIELVHCTPTVFRNLCNGGLTGRTFNRLKHVLIAGEQLRGVHLARWYQAFGNRVQLVNLYGPTETTLAKLYYFVSPQDVGRAAIPIGQPIKGAQVRIMATLSQECKVGEIGEVYIETEFGTLGYYGQPALNSEAFDRDPARSHGPVTYKTGDLAKRLPDGNIEFVGRKDGQQKIRGKQIDLGRIEDEIIQHTEIESCIVAVITTPEGGGADHVVVYYVANDKVDEQLSKQCLARDLPKYMIPDIWVRVDSLPTNANGKVHNSELDVLFSRYGSTERSGCHDSVQTMAGTESRLLKLWKELLRNDLIGLDDPFMEVGGDSLSIMLLIARLDQEYGYNLSLWEVFDSLTIRKLAVLVDGGATSTNF